MATLNEYYKTDFSRYMGINKSWILQDPNGNKIDISAQVHLDFLSNAKFVSFFVPKVTDPIRVFIELINHLDNALKILDDIGVKTTVPGDSEMDIVEMNFTKRIYIYSENQLEPIMIQELIEVVKKDDLFLHIRDSYYLTERIKNEKPLAFISHDSKDKEKYASKIAIGLQRLMCPVWYDEFSLKVGDSLRESIEKGLKKCKKCILILSPNYLENKGWTKIEFNSIFTREIIETRKLVLPVWCGISKGDLFEYSPSLVDRVGINWEKGEDEVIRKLYSSITTTD
jgi:hypothetical protein